MMEQAKETTIETEGTEKDTQTSKSEIDINKLTENPEFKKFMDSYADKRVTDAVKTTKKKLQDEFDQEKKKSEMSQEELLKQKEVELKERELKLEKVQYFKEKNYDLDLLDFVLGEDIDEISGKADVLIASINKVVEKQIAERLKNGYVPPKDHEQNTAESFGLKLAKQATNNQQLMADGQKNYFN